MIKTINDNITLEGRPEALAKFFSGKELVFLSDFSIENEILEEIYADDFKMIEDGIKTLAKDCTEAISNKDFTVQLMTRIENMRQSYNWVIEVEKEATAILNFLNQENKNSTNLRLGVRNRYLFDALEKILIIKCTCNNTKRLFGGVDAVKDFKFSSGNAIYLLNLINMLKQKTEESIETIVYFLKKAGRYLNIKFNDTYWTTCC